MQRSRMDQHDWRGQARSSQSDGHENTSGQKSWSEIVILHKIKQNLFISPLRLLTATLTLVEVPILKAMWFSFSHLHCRKAMTSCDSLRYYWPLPIITLISSLRLPSYFSSFRKGKKEHNVCFTYMKKNLCALASSCCLCFHFLKN